MFDSQSVLVHHVVVDVEGIMKQAFGEAVAPEGLSRPRLSKFGERDFAVLDTDQSILCHAQKGGPVGHEFRHLLGAHDALPGVFLGVPDGFEKVVNPFSLDRGQKRRRGQAAMMQFDVTLRSATYFRVVTPRSLPVWRRVSDPPGRGGAPSPHNLPQRPQPTVRSRIICARIWRVLSRAIILPCSAMSK